MKRPALTYVLCEGAVKNSMWLSVTSCTNKQQPLMLPCRWLQTCTTSLLLMLLPPPPPPTLLLLLSQLYWLSEPCLLPYLEEHCPLPAEWCKRCRVDGTLEQSERVVPNGWVKSGQGNSTAQQQQQQQWRKISAEAEMCCVFTYGAETRSKQAVAD